MKAMSSAKRTVTKLKTSAILALLALGSLTGQALASPAAPPAQETDPLKNLKGAAGAGGYTTTGGTPDPAKIAGNIIGYALGLLGIVFVVLTIYAGFLWMTAQGNEEQIKKAKGMITNAVIGFIIISLAYVITSFVVTNVTTGVTATT